MSSTIQATRAKLGAFKDIIVSWFHIPTLKEFIERNDGTEIIKLIANSRVLRAVLFRVFEKQIKRFYLENESVPMPARWEQFYSARAVIHSIARLAEDVEDKPVMKRTLTEKTIPSLMKAVVRQQDRGNAYKEQYGEGSPGFLTISPTKACNLRCKGCYANASSASKEKLRYDVFSRILEEKKQLWGSWFTVISGGEPFMYRSQGKDLLDVVAEHPDNYFLVYTNGTLIDEQTARRLAELGNVTPAISVEGYERETDYRRGDGVYRKILDAFRNLRTYGVPFGVSMTAFNHNADMFNRDLFDHYINTLGAYYIWIFQYMPIGREQSLDMLVTPEQRVRMYRDTAAAIRDEDMFIADFWNSGTASGGCISAGKDGGYLYVDWDGNVTPCVFNPYSPVNINRMYAEGKTLNDVVQHPFFTSIRQWQSEYGTDVASEETGNWLRPCPIKDHYRVMLQKLRTYEPVPIDTFAEQALHDGKYQEGLIRYGEEVEKMTGPIWQHEVIEPEKRRKGIQ